MTAPRPSPVALVTGAASGMGAAIVQRMSADGHRVVVADLDEAAAALSGSELGAYSASKHGVVALVRSAAIEGAGFGVRVNAIAPGSIDTPMMAIIEHALGGDGAARRAIRHSTPLGRPPGPAWTPRRGRRALTAFLLSDDAGWITGATVPIDGGTLAADPYRLATTAAP